jgi:hypothetical protein
MMGVWIAHRRLGPRADRYWVATSGTIVSADAASRIEALTGQRGELWLSAEWLSTGAAVLADSDLAIEALGPALVTVVSIEANADRVRLLATPGRIRLLRRN